MRLPSQYSVVRNPGLVIKYFNETKNRVIDYYIFDAVPSPEDTDFSLSKMAEWMDKGNGINTINDLLLDTVNSNQKLLNFVIKESDNQSIVSFEKYSKEEWIKYLSEVEMPYNNWEEDFFGPLLEVDKANMVKLGIRVREELDTIEVIFLNKEINPSPKIPNVNRKIIPVPILPA